MDKRVLPAAPALRSRLVPLATCAASLFSLGAVAQTIWTVDSCNEGLSGDATAHTGTLRFAVAHAASGDSIDLSTLACSTISLTTGAVSFSLDDLTFTGPANGGLTITGASNAHTALLHHDGYGTLTLRNLAFEYADNRSFGYVHGGCVYSYANIVLDHVRLAHCSATAPSVSGGAVFAHQDLSMTFTSVLANSAHGTTGARGGGAYARGNMRVESSTIDGNTLSGEVNYAGAGGGIFAGGLMMRNSTISNNSTSWYGGGFGVVHTGAAGTYLRMYSSTVSGNVSAHRNGGGYATVPDVVIDNSTIALNRSAKGNRFIGPGLALSAYFTPLSITLQSSLLVDNNSDIADPNGDGSTEYDLTVIDNPFAATFAPASSNNLIRHTLASGVPADTITGAVACPLLGPLRDNGGPTHTHALLSGSIAIDAGNNIAGASQDQRGTPGDAGPPYPFPREANGVADIGAFEFQPADTIFNASLEVCTPIPN